MPEPRKKRQKVVVREDLTISSTDLTAFDYTRLDVPLTDRQACTLIREGPKLLPGFAEITLEREDGQGLTAKLSVERGVVCIEEVRPYNGTVQLDLTAAKALQPQQYRFTFPDQEWPTAPTYFDLEDELPRVAGACDQLIAAGYNFTRVVVGYKATKVPDNKEKYPGPTIRFGPAGLCGRLMGEVFLEKKPGEAMWTIGFTRQRTSPFKLKLLDTLSEVRS